MTTHLVAVTKVAAVTTVPAVLASEVPKVQSVEVEAENMKGVTVRFIVPVSEAPLNGAMLRVTVEEVTP